MIDTNQIRPIDSIKPDNENAEFRIELNNPMLFILKDKGQKIEFIAHPSDSIVINFAQNKVIKSTNPENSNYQDFLSTLEKANQIADSLSYIFIQGQSGDSFPMIRDQVNNSFEKLRQDCKEKAMNYINANQGSVGIFRAINYFLKQTPLFDYSIDYKWFHKTDSLLNIYHPGHPYTTSFHDKIAILPPFEDNPKGIKPGQVLPEIRLQGLNKKITRIEPGKEKLTLVYLWDPTPESRHANTALKQVFEEYKDKGLKLYAIAFDENFERWSSVIVVDKMWWNNMLDTSGNNSRLLDDLNNPSLPYFIIIDHNRKVLSTHLNATQTREWLREYLNK
ncbi:MAG TPA: thioredoxin-like domain-containing protein [Lentimicrobium sp.]|nr:thioredoxin-like domain-containing protein [Lentimicrobium sp.]